MGDKLQKPYIGANIARKAKLLIAQFMTVEAIAMICLLCYLKESNKCKILDGLRLYLMMFCAKVRRHGCK